MFMPIAIRILDSRPKRYSFYWYLAILFIAATQIIACQPSSPSNPLTIGDAPGILVHVSSDNLLNGEMSTSELIAIGEQIFNASLNTLDGATNSKVRLIGDGSAAFNLNTRFNRISGPDANSCAGCHNIPSIGGGGDNVANVFVLAHQFPNVNFDNKSEDLFENLSLTEVGNERGTISMFGSGLIELIAREMTADLLSIREIALKRAELTKSPVTADLKTKGVYFGKLIAWPDGLVDASKIEGIDEDLIVKPFSQKGVFTSLREFTITSMELHHGIQSEERVGTNVDADLDGVKNELTIGDITAISLFQASLPAPFRQQPTSDSFRLLVDQGEQLFNEIGCSVCHKPSLTLNNPTYFEPNPFNPEGTVSDNEAMTSHKIDLSKVHQSNAIQKTANGSYLVYAYTDLKRHDMGPVLDNEQTKQRFVETNMWITRKLWGIMSEPPFLHHGRATILSEAILAHQGEANHARLSFESLHEDQKDSVIEFLKTFRSK